MKKSWTNYFGEQGEFVDENGVLNKTIDDKINRFVYEALGV